MKTIALLLPLLSVAVIGYAGQTNQIDLFHAAPAPRAQAPGGLAGPGTNQQAIITADQSATNSAQRLFRAEKKYGGVLPDLQRRKGQFFKPAPPSSRPPGFENVSINPITGQAEGIILFSIKF